MKEIILALGVLLSCVQCSLVTCPSNQEGNILLPHQFECSSFFLCDGSGSKPSFLLRCPTGLYFNTVHQNGSCLDTTETVCRSQIGVGPVSELQRTLRSPPLPPIDAIDNYRNYTMHLPDPMNCQQFYRYEGQKEPQLYECPGDLQFDPVLEICDLPEEVNCRSRDCQDIPEPRCPPNNESTSHLPHPTDCNAFYICNWGNPILFHCPGDLYFNPAIGVCDWPQNVECNRCQTNTEASPQ